MINKKCLNTTQLGLKLINDCDYKLGSMIIDDMLVEDNSFDLIGARLKKMILCCEDYKEFEIIQNTLEALTGHHLGYIIEQINEFDREGVI